MFLAPVPYLLIFSLLPLQTVSSIDPFTACDNGIDQTDPQQNTHTLAHMASTLKKILRLLPQPTSHWVGDGFNVFPVFADYAFTADVSPFLMVGR